MKKILSKSKLRKLTSIGFIAFSLTTIISLSALYNQNNRSKNLYTKVDAANEEKQTLLERYQNLEKEYDDFKNTDQVKVNEDLKAEIDDIHDTYKKTVSAYEDLLELKDKNESSDAMDKYFAEALSFLADNNYNAGSESLNKLISEIDNTNQRIAQEAAAAAAAAAAKAAAGVEKNEPPSSGYSRQLVTSDAGKFTVSLVAADISSTKVIVDTASNNDCGNDCPVLSLAAYVTRNNAYAGINGSYFCPASYPSCAGKTNSFDLLLMNKNKTYFNSNNNVYSNNPGVIFGNGYVRFVSAVNQWGRDTGIDSMISNFPLLVFNSNVAFGGDDDPKKGSIGNRSFVANKGNLVYIGVVHSVTVAQSARVLHAMGMENAMNLDSGGSTALWSGGYKAGPGRDIPNAILFVRK